jgi:predicted dehydrogenase
MSPKIDQVLTLFGTPKSISAHVWNSRAQGSEKFDDAFIAQFTYPPGSFQRENSVIPLIVTIRSASLSLLERQLRFTVKGTKATWVKFGLDTQEDQLKLVPPMSTTHADYGVEPKENEGTLTTEEGGLVRSRTVPTEKGN